MKFKKNSSVKLALAGLLACTISANAAAGGAVRDSGSASRHSVQAVGHSVAAVGKTALTVTALPFLLVGEVGGLSGQAGESMMEAAGTPLPIGDEHATAGPSPDQLITDRSE